MENIPLPSKIEIADGSSKHEGIISIYPCQPGFGTTLGNALRRVLISSLPGAAVIAFKIKGVSHEFSTIEHVKEDVVEIILNLKQLRLKVFSDEPVRIELKAKGDKKVTAKDIKASSDVEIVNPELVIATLTDKNAELEMELIVGQGRGYVPTEVREKESIEVDMIMVDSIFTPVRNVGLAVEHVRVGQMTNFEKLVLTIETDGTISPAEALIASNQILLDHFNFIAGESLNLGVKEVKKEKKAEKNDEAGEPEEKDEKGEKEEKKAAKKTKKSSDKKKED